MRPPGATTGSVQPQPRPPVKGRLVCIAACRRRSLLSRAKLELAYPDRQVEASLGLDAQRLKGEGLAGAAHQEVCASADHRCGLRARAEIITGERAGAYLFAPATAPPSA